MKRVLLFIILASMAKASIGQIRSHDPGAIDWDGKATQAELQIFSECAVSRHPDLAGQMVLDFSTYKFDIKKYLDVFDPECMLGTFYALSIPPTTARFAIALALVRGKLGPVSADVIRGAGPLEYPPIMPADFAPKSKKISTKQQKDWDEAVAKAHSTLAVLAFGECVGRANPDGAHAFLLAKANSQAETSTVAGLSSALSDCVPKGTQLRIDKISLRGALSIAYYRRSKAPRPDSSVGVKG